jgi:Domain of unknown function (DUF5047)
MNARARVCAPGQTGTNPLGVVIDITSGDVKLDATADIRGTLDMTTMHHWPTSSSDLLTPYGNEIFVERGVIYGGGSTEWVSQGYYRMYSVDQDDPPDGPIVIAGRDRMSGIIDAKRESPIQFADGTSVAAVFTLLVGEVYPGATIVYDFDATLVLFTTSHILDNDRYQFLKDIVDSLGKVMYWDYAGILQVRSAPDPAAPVFSVNHGAGGVLVSMARSLNREGGFNAVVATGEQAGEQPPVRGVAYDLNPSSPTYFNGPFGKVIYQMNSTFITTANQATVAAQAMLARSLGVPYTVDFSMVPHAGLEPLDPISVSYSDRVAAEGHVIETLTIPLTAEEAMTGTTRQQVWGSS